MSDVGKAVAYLRSPLAIRARCENVLEAGLAGKLGHFAVDLAALPAVTARVVAITRATYPDLAVPVHGLTSHFRAMGVDRVAAFEAKLAPLSADERARAWFDLIIVSVLLDAGAGDRWRYREPGTGLALGRSEGLAVASLHAFEAGLFSATKGQPLRADAGALHALDSRKLAQALQWSPENTPAGLDGRIELLRNLGAVVLGAPHVFPGGRPGGLYDQLRAGGAPLTAAGILAALLDALAPIWPGRLELDGTNLGDVWRHPAAGGTGPSAGFVPFHQLSQWLAYSLVEPLARAGLPVAQPGALTALPEYRSGGLLVDLGVLVPRHEAVRTKVHEVGDEVIVEWRALTVALLDRVAAAVQQALGKTPAELPLACVLEGGTWAAGRLVARELRPGGGPPIRIHSDGTVF